MTRNQMFALAFVVLVLGLALAGTERNEEQIEHEYACEMLQIWEDSGGEYGHPNHDNRECN